ncbi:MAG: hypothetical protein H3Z50_01725 [archaeon]|nr:hypothetical protein [archaeon]MCP8305573.1 hypothetical protein [archaeon]
MVETITQWSLIIVPLKRDGTPHTNWQAKQGEHLFLSMVLISNISKTHGKRDIESDKMLNVDEKESVRLYKLNPYALTFTLPPITF